MLEFFAIVSLGMMVIGIALLKVNGGVPNDVQKLGWVFIALSLISMVAFAALLIVDYGV